MAIQPQAVTQCLNCEMAIFFVQELGEDGWLHVYSNKRECPSTTVAQPTQ